MNQEKKTKAFKQYNSPKMDKTKVRRKGKGNISFATLDLVKFLDEMEVDTSASLDNFHHSRQVHTVLQSSRKSKNPAFDPIKDKSFVTGMGLDGTYHVWRDG